MSTRLLGQCEARVATAGFTRNCLEIKGSDPHGVGVRCQAPRGHSDRHLASPHRGPKPRCPWRVCPAIGFASCQHKKPPCFTCNSENDATPASLITAGVPLQVGGGCCRDHLSRRCTFRAAVSATEAYRSSSSSDVSWSQGVCSSSTGNQRHVHVVAVVHKASRETPANPRSAVRRSSAERISHATLGPIRGLPVRRRRRTRLAERASVTRHRTQYEV